ncbi:hypothetical protein EON62_05950, partial [archaeon]
MRKTNASAIRELAEEERADRVAKSSEEEAIYMHSSGGGGGGGNSHNHMLHAGLPLAGDSSVRACVRIVLAPHAGVLHTRAPRRQHALSVMLHATFPFLQTHTSFGSDGSGSAVFGSAASLRGSATSGGGGMHKMGARPHAGAHRSSGGGLSSVALPVSSMVTTLTGVPASGYQHARAPAAGYAATKATQ